MSIQLPEDRYIRVGGINTRYWVAGDKGTAIVLVHGLGGFIENWMYNIGPLAEAHRVYAMDLVGFGRSDKTPLTRDLSVLVRVINDFMETLNIDKASLIGNSMGGGLVLAFALEYPQKVEKLVLADNAGMGREVISDFKLCSLPFVGELLIRPNPKRTARLWQKIVYDSSLISPEFLALSYRLAAQPGAKKALLSTLRAGINLLGQKNKLTRVMLEKVKDLKAPSLIVWGKEDRIIPATHAQIALEKIPGARLELFDRCGHMPMFEHPDEFNKLVLDFLAG